MSRKIDHEQHEASESLLTAEGKNLFSEFFLNIIGFFFLTGIFGPIIILSLQVLLWLKNGNWPQWTIEWGLNLINIKIPEFTWVGIQKIENLILSLPLALGVAAFGMFGFYILAVASEKCSKDIK